MVSAGADLAANLLKQTGAQLPAGRSRPLPLATATGLFDVFVGGKMLAPQSVEVAGDGLEFHICMLFPLNAPPSLRLVAKFLPALPSVRNVSLVIGDENGNIFASAILSPSHPSADFNLPSTLFLEVVETNQVPPASAAKTQTHSSAPVMAGQRPGFNEFFPLGIRHILTGYDHLLFLCALLLGCRRLKPMLLVITGFTLAHSLTLVLAALNLVVVSSRLVEPLIAVSIIFVAAENLRRAGRNEDGGLKMEGGINGPGHPPCSILNLRRPDAQRYALTCGFGLVHGFGFAGALRETGMASGGAGLAMPLLAFNLGVETGQLAVAAVFLPALFALRRWRVFERVGTRLFSAVIMLIAAYWFWIRLTISGE